MNWRSEMVAPVWKNGRTMRLGGSAPLVATLGGESPSTADASQVPSARRVSAPNETPVETSAAVCPGSRRSRMDIRSTVIWRASISMKPEPNMPIVARLSEMDSSCANSPFSMSAPRPTMVSA